MLVTLCVRVCVHRDPNNKMFVITFDMAHCSRQGYGYCEGTGKLGAILLATVIVSCDYLPSAPQQQHPPQFHWHQAAFTSFHCGLSFREWRALESKLLSLFPNLNHHYIVVVTLELIWNWESIIINRKHPTDQNCSAEFYLLLTTENYSNEAATPCFYQCPSWQQTLSIKSFCKIQINRHWSMNSVYPSLDKSAHHGSQKMSAFSSTLFSESTPWWQVWQKMSNKRMSVKFSSSNQPRL